MSKFYVGQKVRLIECGLFGYTPRSPLTGKTGTVSSEAYTSRLGDTRYRVALDDGDEAQSIPEGLEPIDDSRDLTTWDACAWRPKDARVSA